MRFLLATLAVASLLVATMTEAAGPARSTHAYRDDVPISLGHAAGLSRFGSLVCDGAGPRSISYVD